MAQLRIDASAFSLSSKYKCGTEAEIKHTYVDTNGDGIKEDVTDTKTTAYIEEPATTAQHTVTFDLTGLPEGATVTGATVYATLGNPMHGVEISTINGVSVGVDGEKSVPITVANSATSVVVNFVYKCEAAPHVHYFDGSPQTGHYWDGDTLEVYIFKAEHEGVVSYSNVYLLVEYKTEGAGGYIYRAENGVLVPYNFYHAENGALVLYNLLGTSGDYERVTQNMITADGEQFYTSDGNSFKVLGGM
jgi:hypothetical protein